MDSVCVCVHMCAQELDFWRLGCLNAACLIYCPYPFCQLYLISALSILYSMQESLYICGRCLIFNAVMSEGRRYCHALSFAHCVRMNNLGSGNSDVQSSWSVLTSCHMRSLWTGCWGSGACPLLCSQPLESSVCRQDSASLEEECQVRVCETQDRAEPRSVTASM